KTRPSSFVKILHRNLFFSLHVDGSRNSFVIDSELSDERPEPKSQGIEWTRQRVRSGDCTEKRRERSHNNRWFRLCRRRNTARASGIKGPLRSRNCLLSLLGLNL